MENIISSNLDIFIRLGIALVLGMAIGAERIIHHKAAGMRTYAMVSMGASLFIVVSEMVRSSLPEGFNPVHMAASIITGIGFLGAGLIIFRQERLVGLTTASGLWVSAGIGIASGFGLYNIAVIATLLTLFIFIVLYLVEKPIRKLSENNGTGDEM